jgi:death on curing protein
VLYDDIVFLDVEDVHAAHDAAIELFGGAPSVLDPGLVESATMAPQTGYYDTLAELAAVYTHGIAKNHGYQDGNKRTATLVMLKFLGANGYPIDLPSGWTETMVQLAEGTISRAQLTALITALMGGDPVSIEDAPSGRAP